MLCTQQLASSGMYDTMCIVRIHHGIRIRNYPYIIRIKDTRWGLVSFRNTGPYPSMKEYCVTCHNMKKFGCECHGQHHKKFSFTAVLYLKASTTSYIFTCSVWFLSRVYLQLYPGFLYTVRDCRPLSSENPLHQKS